MTKFYTFCAALAIILQYGAPCYADQQCYNYGSYIECQGSSDSGGVTPYCKSQGGWAAC